MDKKTTKRVGVKDIAAKAGVSIGTVDRVLHNRGEVKQETKEKILAIVDELGYKPNVFARSLSAKKTMRIAIVIPDSSDNNPYWEKPLGGIKKAADALDNFHVEIIYERYDASNEKSFSDVLNRVVKELPDGVVLNPTFKSVALHFISILSANNIPYVFIDVNIKGVGKLGYFGQDAEQSGLVAGKLMDFNAPKNSEIVILKQAKNKIFSQHIESRIEGFLKYFEKKNTSHMYDFHTVEVDLSDCDEPSSTLSKLFAKGKNYSGIFVPNSRSFLVADYLEKHKIDQLFVIGYDLVDKNCEHLEKGNITCLLSQKPEDQAYNAIMALVDHLVYKKDVAQTNYSPIDIVIQENINYYKTRS